MSQFESQSEKENFALLYDKIIELRDSIRISDKESNFETFEAWFQENQSKLRQQLGFKDRFIKKSSISNLLATLKKWSAEDADPTKLQPLKRKRNEAIKKAESFVVIARHYLDKDNESSETDISSEASIDSNEIQDCWYCYYLNPHKVTRVPRIARTVLIRFENGHALLKGLKEDSFSVDLYGPYRKMGSHVDNYDLENLPDRTRGCNIKVLSPSKELSLVVGIFTTYDLHDIRSGSLVLQKIEQVESTAEPIQACHFESPENYKYIPDPIQIYLFERSKNHGTVPRAIGDQKSLQDWMSKRPKWEVANRVNRFFDFKESKLFIAAQQTSFHVFNEEHEVENKVIQSAITKLKLELPNVQVVERVKKGPQNADSESFDSLMDLKRTKYFVLLIGRHDKASFSTVMLGWAMAHCMHILLIYKKDTASSRFLALDKLRVDLLRMDEFDELNLVNAIVRFVNSKR